MKHLPWAVLLILLVLGYGCHREQVGELKGKIAHLERETQRVDTVYLNRTKERRIVLVRTDSVLRTDTVFRDTTVRRLILGERLACDAVIQTCEQRVAIRDSLIKSLKKKPSVWSKVPWLVGGAVLGKILLK